MTIEEQMLEAIEKARYDWGLACGGDKSQYIAEYVTKIALELAEKAYDKGLIDQQTYGYGRTYSFKQFIQDYE